MKDLSLDYNSTYISINLIDELDYVVGGYGQPNAVFIYSLNAFLEAFIFNNHFYVSGQEASHFQIVSKAMFPNGRPILELIAKTKCLKAIGGIGNDIAKVVSIGKFDPKNPTSYQERVQHYINHGLPEIETREKYLVLPQIDGKPSEIKYLNIGKVEDGYVATESSNLPEKFYKKLCDITRNTNVQSTLPYYSYEYQIQEVQSRGLGKEIITKLSESFTNRKGRIDQYFGYKNQSIPPLVSILLSQSNSLTEIPDKIFQLREDFTELRNSIVKYEKRINEADSIKDQLDAIDEVQEFWKVFNKKYSEDSRLLYQFWELAEDSDYEKSLDNAIDNQDPTEMIDDLNIGKVAGKGAKKLFDWYKEKRILNRFRGVTDIWKLFENTPNVKKQIPEFERVFNFQLDVKELALIEAKMKKLHTTGAKNP